MDRDEVINDLKKLKLRNWSQPIKGRKTWNDLVQKTKNLCRFDLCNKRKMKSKEEEEKDYYYYCVVVAIVVIIACHRPFLAVTSLEPTTIPTVQASGFRLQ
jgi:hypothetical protein